ncbi:MAG: hypothetical protein OXG77_02130 [Chloroflexi bacterium]|nr:hypothetical protein [Chloroflexota bacterium]
MNRFSERQGHRPSRADTIQLESMDERLKNAIWNFLYARFLGENSTRALRMLGELLLQIAGGRADEVSVFHQTRLSQFSTWYFNSAWFDVYDALEYSLQKFGNDSHRKSINEILEREGSAYRFVGGFIAPISNEMEADSVGEAANQGLAFNLASQHISQAIAHLGNRSNPDYRNSIKEAVSAVETGVQIAAGSPGLRFEKAVNSLDLHPQFKQALQNLFRWASDEDGVRHGMHSERQVGFPDARMVLVMCSAIVNFLIVEFGD